MGDVPKGAAATAAAAAGSSSKGQGGGSAAPCCAVMQVLQAWCDSGSHFVLPGQASDPAAAAAAASGSSRPQPSPEEVGQRSVDALLVEYYRMVKSASTTAEGGPGALQAALLALLCPRLPDGVSLDALLRAASGIAGGAAVALSAAAALLVPLLLAFLATLLQAGRHREAAATAAVGLAVLMLADAAARRRAAAREAERLGAVTAANVRDVLPAGGSAVVARCFPASGSRGAPAPQAAAAAGSLLKSQQQQQPLLPQGVGGGDAALLLPALEALQQVVFGAADVGSGVEDPRETVAAGLRRVAATVGYPLTPASLESSDAMAAAIAGLRRHLGCS
ncbi:hypothetical protein Rsub_09863 [Raphidocelis subcapitata]|uniref:Uncharacterized protein n=1 Tax=Raphidocelis subcapitata TaxID=307507 RepID=A0A2V0P9K1_9CHLO|nr:hypothetical protein Rsub_09863 [Raphidocelis subcapitata]|eukprot:GBF96521.1 hypothetical protein Rsub_09863 [Raphidocelis subcapitata]